LDEDSFIDENGYRRKKIQHSNLIHRNIAYEKIYIPNKKLYPLPFSKYQVHHKDKNKLNNNVSNLQLVTREEHEIIHGVNKSNTITELKNSINHLNTIYIPEEEPRREKFNYVDNLITLIGSIFILIGIILIIKGSIIVAGLFFLIAYLIYNYQKNNKT